MSDLVLISFCRNNIMIQKNTNLLTAYLEKWNTKQIPKGNSVTWQNPEFRSISWMWNHKTKSTRNQWKHQCIFCKATPEYIDKSKRLTEIATKIQAQWLARMLLHLCATGCTGTSHALIHRQLRNRNASMIGCGQILQWPALTKPMEGGHLLLPYKYNIVSSNTILILYNLDQFGWPSQQVLSNLW